MITIDTDYKNHLLNAKSTFYKQDLIHPPKGSLSAPKIVDSINIPPLNTDINFEKLNSIKLKDHPSLNFASPNQFPVEFNWNEISKTDDQKIKLKKKIISKPGNQMLCGSCWEERVNINK